MQFTTASEVHDFFEYVEIDGSNQVILPECLRDARNCLQSLVQNLGSNVTKHWFSLAIDSLDSSIEAFASGDDDRGSTCLVDAREWLEYGLTGRKLKADYIVDANGIVRRSGNRSDGL